MGTLEPGEQIDGRYRIHFALGAGGMGQVFAATDEVLEQPVALKVLRAELQALDAARLRMEREATTASAVRHPNCVRVLAQGQWQGASYIVMERLLGEDAAQRLARRGRLSPPEACRIVHDASLALGAIHATGVVHRDLKPANLFLAETERGVVVKVLDFGIAKLVGADTLTRTQERFGTLSYTAPEQLRSAKLARASADVYALGAVLFALLAGRPPHVAAARMELVAQILNDRAPFLQVPGVPEEVASLAAACLEKSPSDRPPLPSLQAALQFHSGEVCTRDLDRCAFEPPAAVSPKPGAADDSTTEFD